MKNWGHQHPGAPRAASAVDAPVHVPYIFAATLFASAALLFWLQPMFTKMVLPLFGGSSAVWTTAAMFFQLGLLGGYLYAHAISRLPSMRVQFAVHFAVLALACVALPVAVSEPQLLAGPTPPLVSLLVMLTVGLGLPFFAIAATAPLLQSWLSRTRHRTAADPYFLYSASNLGSMVALIGYPAIIETLLGLNQQSSIWAIGYGILGALILACASIAWRYRRDYSPLAGVDASPAPGWRQRGCWMILAFTPSSLLLGVTQHVTNEIAAIPLLWLVPLLLYTLTFVIAFAPRPLPAHRWALKLQPPLVILLALVWTLNTYLSVFALHLVVFFVTALMCHGELALRRPSPAHLTEFYLWMAVGGALGGTFNAVCAPLIFSTIIEYPLIIGLACMLRAPRLGNGWRAADAGWPILLALLIGALVLARIRPFELGAIGVVAYLQVVGLALYLSHMRPARFGLMAIVVLVGGSVLHGADDILARHRSFFGVHTVLLDKSGKFNVLTNGVTIHGAQHVDPERRREQTTYYHRDGALGQMFSALGTPERFNRVAAVGLGVGTAACYRLRNQEWTFYELDAVVARLAADTRYFRFLSECAPLAEIVVGDGRLSMRAASDYSFDLIIIDAFSSDAIPVHMITREALALYLRKLRPGGVVMFHVTNQYLDLTPVLANLAGAAGLAGLMPGPRLSLPPDDRYGQMESRWVALARSAEHLAALESEEGWVRLPPLSRARLWTDDYSNVLGALK